MSAKVVFLFHNQGTKGDGNKLAHKSTYSRLPHVEQDETADITWIQKKNEFLKKVLISCTGNPNPRKIGVSYSTHYTTSFFTKFHKFFQLQIPKIFFGENLFGEKKFLVKKKN